MSGESLKAMQSAGGTPEREPGFYPVTLHDSDIHDAKTTVAELRREKDGCLRWHFVDSAGGFSEDYLRLFDPDLHVGERIEVRP